MGPATILGRFDAALRRKGAPVTFTAVTRTAGPTPLVNPPDVAADDLAADGDTVLGATTIALRSSIGRGVLLPGDKILFGLGGSLGVATVTAAAYSRAIGSPMPGFDAVSITPLTVALLDGTPAAIVAKASFSTFGMIDSFPNNLIDGKRILQRDLRIDISALGMPEPQPGWRVTFGGRDYVVVQTVPAFIRSTMVKFEVQAR